MTTWKAIPLNEVVTVKGGGTPSTDVAAYWQGDIPWVSPKDMKSDEIDSSQDTISRLAVENSATNMIPKGSVLVVTRSGILARTIPVGLAIRDLTVNQDIKALCPKNGIDPRFLFYFLRASERDLLKRVTRGATVHRLSTDDIRALRFPIVPLPEQKRIVAILDEAFEGIDKAIANTEKNLANARELFESALASEFVSLRPRSSMLTLAEASKDFGRGKSKHRPRNDKILYGGPYPFIQTGDVRNSDHYITKYEQTYSEAGLRQSKLWPRGTICITIAANIAETGVLAFDACFPDSVIGVVVDDDRADHEFVEYLLQSFKAELKAKGKGSAQDNINLGTFENARFPFPPLADQRTTVAKLNALSLSVSQLRKGFSSKLMATHELRQSLLAKAFSGQLAASKNLAEAAE